MSAAKYARAERELNQARPLGEGIQVFYNSAEIEIPDEGPERKTLYIAVTSDRGNAMSHLKIFVETNKKKN